MKRTDVNLEYAIEVFEIEMGRKFDIKDEKDKAVVCLIEIGIRHALAGNLLSSDDYDSLHDTIYEATDKSFSKGNLYKIWLQVPEDIKAEVVRWGMNDTPTRDNLYVWAEENLQLFNQYEPIPEESGNEL